jgi:hypothetical protein
MTPFACKLLPEQVFGFRKPNVVERRVFASHFPSDEVQNEAEVRGSIPFTTPMTGQEHGRCGRAH